MVLRRQLQILRTVRDLLYYSKFQNGICGVLEYQLQTSRITKNEYKFIRDLLETHKPTPENDYKIFTENDYWIKDKIFTEKKYLVMEEIISNDNCWWVKMGENSETRKIRIEYLTQVIFNLINK